MKTIVITTESGFINQLENYLLKIKMLVTLLGLSALKIAVLEKDLLLLKYIYAESLSFKTSSEGINAYKHILLFGGDLGEIPLQPELPASPVPVLTSAGVIKRFRDIVQDTAKSPKITEDIMRTLGILAPESKEDLNV